MSKVLDSATGAALTAAQNDSNLSSVSGINEIQSGTTHTIDIDDQNKTIEYSNASAVTVTLTLLSTITGATHTDDYRVILKSLGAGGVTINTNVADTFDDTSTSITLAQYDCVEIQSSNTATIWNKIRFYDDDAPTLTGTETFTNKTISGGANNLDSVVATTSGATVDISTSVPSWVKQMYVNFNGVSTNGTDDILVQIGSTTYTTSGYISNASLNNNTPSSNTGGFRITQVSVAADAYYGIVTINLLDAATDTWVYTSSIYGATGRQHMARGILVLGGTLDRVRLTTTSGTDTFDAGNVSLGYS